MKSRAISPVLVVAAVVATGLWLQGATPSVPTGQWQTGAPLGQPRTGAVPVMLDDGRVLLIGGRAAGAPVAAVDVVDPDGSITAGIPLSLPRAGHTAVRLADGSVLVAGGTTLVAGDQGTVEAATATAEVLYAGATQWIAATGLTQARTGATATSLSDGRVLVAGGADDNGPLDTFEIYDPISTTFHPGGLLSAARAGHAAAVAGNTSVLVAGGHNASGAIGTADIIDADTGGVVTVTMTAARDGASATALLDGRVLVAGGWDGTNDLATAEVIDPVAATTTATLPMGSPRRDHQALLLEHNATVLITGGTNAGAVSLTAEQFVAWENGFRPTNPPAVGRSGALTSPFPADGVALLAAGQGADSSLVVPTELYGFATLHTDKDDYAPGTFVTITGSGWQPGETVNLVLHETGPNADPDVPLNAQADPNGNILNDVWAPNEGDLGRRFYLTATGSASTAQLTFTDAKNLDITFAGTGSGTITFSNMVPGPTPAACTATCSRSLDNSQTGTLTVAANAGSVFNGWSGTFGGGGTTTCTGTTSPCNFSMSNSGQALTATFTGPKLAITSVNSGANPTAGTPFNVVVQSQNGAGVPLNVSANTGVTLSLNTGTGIIGGTLTGTILAGTSSVTISGVTYTKAESGVTLRVTRTSGDLLTTATSASFTVNAGAASALAFVQQPSTATAGATISPAITVQVTDSVGNNIAASGVPVTLALTAGTGVLSGTTTQNTNGSGLATFAGLSINLSGSKNLTASSGSFTVAVSNAFTINPGTPTKLVIFSVNGGANPTAGTAFAVVVQSQDNNGNLANVTAITAVTLSVNTGTGTLNGTVTGNISSGTNSVTISPSYTKAESGVVLTATRTSGNTLAAGNSAPFTVNAGAANKLAFVQQPTNATAGAAISPAVTVQLQDQLGNNVTTSGTSIVMSLSTGTGTLSGTTTQTTTSGLATFTDLSINLVGSKNLTASSSGLTAAISSAFTISAGTADKLAFVQQPTTTTAGSTITPAVTVQVQDQFGNSVAGAGVSVGIALTTGTGTLSGTTPQPTNAGGLATFNNLSINLAGPKNLTATSGLLTPAVSGAFTINAATANKLVFVQQPTDVQAGASISPAVTVQLQDQFGNNVTTSGTSVLMTLSTGNGALSGTTTQNTNGSGVATFSNLSINLIGSKNLTATSGSLTAAVSTSFNVTPAAINNFAVTAPASTLANSAFNVTVTARDQFGNTITGYLGTVHFASTDVQAVLPANYTFLSGDAGVQTFSVTLKTPGSQSVTVNDTVTTSATGSASIAVNQAPAITSANNATFTVGSAGSFTVTATGFPAPTFSKTGTLPSGVNFSSSGVLSGTPAAGTGGSYPITITATNGISPDDTQSFTLTVNQAPAITSANNTSFIVNTASSFTVTATGFPAPTFSEIGALPAGVTLDATTGALAGTPTVTGTFPITITASNGVGSNATQAFTLTVGQPPAITSANNTAFTVNSNGSFTVTATGFPAPTFTKTGTLPNNVTLSSTGVLSGTPALGTVGSYPITITASNGIGSNATQNFTLTVNKGNVTFTINTTTTSITYGTSSIAVSGRVNGPAMLGGTVTVTADGASLSGLSLSGNPNNFSGNLTTSAVPAAATPYVVSYSYSGNADFNPATDTTTTLTVNKATPTATLTVTNSPQTYTGAPQAATVGISTSSVPGAVSNVLTGGAATKTNAGTYAVTADFVPTDSANYNTLTGLSAGNFVISKATPTVTVAFAASPIPYDGAPHPATVTVTGVSGPLTIPADGATNVTYLKSGSPSGIPTNAGSYTASATFTSTNANYNNASSTADATLVIDKATPTATLAVTNSPQTYTGAPQAATVSTSASSVPGAVANVLTGGAATQTNAGTYAVTADFVPTDSANYNTLTSQSAGNLVINKATPTATLTVTNSPQTYTGAPLAATVGISTSSVPGVVANVLTGGAATQTHAGTYAVTADFEPTDSANYNSLTGLSAGNFVINKATPTATLTVTNSPQTYTGAPQAATVGISTSSVPGAVSNVLTGGAATQTHAGTYAVTADFVPTDSANYNTLTSQSAGNFVINKATPTATLVVTNSPQTYTGAPQAATVGVTTSSVPGAVANVLTGGAATQTHAGTYAVTADFEPTDSANYNSLTGLSAGNFVINKATPTATLVVTNSPQTYSGAPQAATVSVSISSVPGTAANVLTGGAATQTHAGTYAVTADFEPTDSANYNSVPGLSAGNFVINKATPTATLAVTNSPQTYTGAPQTATVGVNTSSVPGTVSNVLTGGAATQTNAGTYPVTADFLPTDSANYNSLPGLPAGNFVINRATPVFTVLGATCTYDGNPCMGSATAKGVLDEPLTPLNLAYSATPGPGNLLPSAPVNAGTYYVSARYAGDANYSSAQAATPAQIVIHKGTPTATLVVTNSPQTYTAAPQAASVAISISSVPGTAANVLTGGVATQTNAGTYAVTADFVPTDTANYNTLTGLSAGNFVIDKATPTATLVVTNSPQTYTGAPQAATVSISTSSVPGAVANVLTGGAATQTNAGAYAVTADFVPTDSANYNSLTGLSAGSFVIDKATPVFTVTGATCTYDGNPCVGTATAKGVLDEPLTPLNLAYSATLGPGSLLPSAPVNAGTYYVSARYAGDVNYKPAQAATAAQIVINKATPTATLHVTNSPQTYTGAGQAATVGITISSVPGVVANVLTGGAATQTTVGTYAVTADFVPSDSANYNTLTGLAAGNFVIDKATPTATLSVTNSPQPYTGAGLAATVEITTSSVPGAVANVMTGGAATQSSAGTYAVTADFVPTDTTNYNTLTSLSAGNFKIDKAPSTTTVTFADGPSVVYTGTTHPATATVIGAGGLNQAVTPVTYNPGGNNAPKDVGSYQADATFTGDANHLGSSGSASLTITQASTNVTITNAASLLSSTTVVGQSYTVNWSVGVVAPGAGTPTGTVTITGGSSCSAAVSVGHCDVTSTSAGLKSLVAAYAGDSNFVGSTSATAPHTVNPADTLTTITTHVPGPSVVGQQVSVSFSVTAKGPGAGTPTGNVTVSDGASTCVATAAVGTCNITFTTAVTHSLTATYVGDLNFNGSASSPSTSHTVNKASTALTIPNAAALASTPTLVGQSYAVQWSIAVTAPGAGSPTGNVTVSDGTASCSAAIAAGSCSVTSATPGLKTVSVTFSGDANFLGSAGSAGHTVQYTFGGFFAPVDNVPVINKANAGQAIPIKWRLTDVNGAGIADPNSFSSLTVYPVACGAWSALPADPLPDQQVSTSGLLYQGSGNWQYNWKTPKNYANTCMVARVMLADGTTHDFDVSFK